MTTTRYAFLVPPVVGQTYHIGARSYRVTDSTPYTRRLDGEESALLTWSTDCEQCTKPFTFQTGPTAGDIQTRCRTCRAVWWRETDARRRRAVADERVIRKPAAILDIWRAVQEAQGDTPRQMSLALNAPRRIFAPVILRDAYGPLQDHSVAEILVGIQEALKRGLIGWDTVGRYKSGGRRRGLWARPEDGLRRAGWWPEEQPAGALD